MLAVTDYSQRPFTPAASRTPGCMAVFEAGSDVVAHCRMLYGSDEEGVTATFSVNWAEFADELEMGMRCL